MRQLYKNSPPSRRDEFCDTIFWEMSAFMVDAVEVKHYFTHSYRGLLFSSNSKTCQAFSKDNISEIHIVRTPGALI